MYTVNYLTYPLRRYANYIRHNLFEIYYRSKLIRDYKFKIKKYIPNIIFEYFYKKKIKKLLKFPESFSIETVNICNAKCWFCPQPDHIRKKGYMDFDIFKKIIDEISLHRDSVKSIALFMDGEPTLHKKLIEFLSYVKSKKIRNVYLSSNMEFFNENLIDKIFENNLNGTLKYIIASLDGVSESVHTSNRIGVDTSKAYQNTKLLIQKKKDNKSIYPWVFPRMLLNETNKHEQDDFKSYWEKKADKVLTTDMHNWGGQIEEEKIFQNKNKPFSSICYFPFSQMFIQIDGKVRICCLDINGQSIFGNLQKQSISEIWSNQDFFNLRKNLKEKNQDRLPKICKNCSYPSKGQWTLPFFWEQEL